MNKSNFASYLKDYGCDYSVIAKLFDIIEKSQTVRDVLKQFIYECETKLESKEINSNLGAVQSSSKKVLNC